MRQIETARKLRLPTIASTWKGRFGQVSRQVSVAVNQDLAKLNLCRGVFPSCGGGRIGGLSAARTRPLTFSRDTIARQSRAHCPGGCYTARVIRHLIANAIRISP